jgi:hypothetical protein
LFSFTIKADRENQWKASRGRCNNNDDDDDNSNNDVSVAVEGRPDSGNWKWNSGSPRSGVAHKILQTEADSKCRLCQQFDETIGHILSACPILATPRPLNPRERYMVPVV